MDTAALRQMIRRKMREKQRAGAYLVTEDEAHDASIGMQQPMGVSSEALHHSQGSKVERTGVDMDNVKACADEAATSHARQATANAGGIRQEASAVYQPTQSTVK